MEGFFVGEFRPKANSSKKERLKMENGIVSHKLFSSIDRKVSFLSLTRLSGIVPTKLFSPGSSLDSKVKFPRRKG